MRLGRRAGEARGGDIMEIQKQLFELQDKAYADFQGKLIPGVDRERVIGVRVPQVRALAKKLAKAPEIQGFLGELPHGYYDENMLHGLLISEMKDFEACIRALDAFLPFVDNWAVCDIMSPKIFKKNRKALLGEIRRWTRSSHVYTCRFGMEMLMTHFLDEDYDPSYLEIPGSVQSEEYYVNTMIAWFFATALAKQWDTVIPYLQEERLSVWVHNKTIQKARESRRITPEQKAYLSTLKRGAEK